MAEVMASAMGRSSMYGGWESWHVVTCSIMNIRITASGEASDRAGACGDILFVVGSVE